MSDPVNLRGAKAEEVRTGRKCPWGMVEAPGTTRILRLTGALADDEFAFVPNPDLVPDDPSGATDT